MKQLRANGGRYRGADIFTDKRCDGKCGRVLDKSEFHNNARSYDGLQDVCKDCFRKVSADWVRRNPVKNRASCKRAYRKNPKQTRARMAARDAAKLHRTPSWSQVATIAEFYSKCPAGFQVDHIVPLQGELVSGLHVIENLQYLTEWENKSKGNRYL
jgi:hypothetical protein